MGGRPDIGPRCPNLFPAIYAGPTRIPWYLYKFRVFACICKRDPSVTSAFILDTISLILFRRFVHSLLLQIFFSKIWLSNTVSEMNSHPEKRSSVVSASACCCRKVRISAGYPAYRENHRWAIAMKKNIYFPFQAEGFLKKWRLRSDPWPADWGRASLKCRLWSSAQLTA